MTALGSLYRNEIFLPQNRAEAYKWDLMAAMAGDRHGMWEVGFYLEDREETFEEAIRWFKKAAMLGDPHSANSIGWWAKSTGEYAESYVWYSIAAASAQAEGSDMVRMYNNQLTGAGAELTPEELAQARQRASDLYEQIIGK
jgi:hypothetical protein